jgi:hypothetical protein
VMLRRSGARLDSRELVCSTGHRGPRVRDFLTLAAPLPHHLAQATSVSPRLWQRSALYSVTRL